MESCCHKALKGRTDYRQGYKPLLKMAATLIPKGRQSSLAPFQGWCYHTDFSRGLHPCLWSFQAYGLTYLRKLNILYEHALLRLLADIGKDATVDIEHVAVDGIRSM